VNRPPLVPGRGYCPVPEWRELNPPGCWRWQASGLRAAGHAAADRHIASPLGRWRNLGSAPASSLGASAASLEILFHMGAREVAPCPCMSPRRF